MDIETSIRVFGETQIVAECDICGRACSGVKIKTAIRSVGHNNVCQACLERPSNSTVGSLRVGNSC
jgi:hypothetical protein